ncbi:hypothetical protein [Micromonospora sp. RTGN7]|uniref:hypothetical protein n=1 Tax=Micromonospora sp. RTGN7 TaxID=3016526 RepID=UPI0029FF349F|nr:hypothetical protein [Micromonospora sp. RTGN7]
MAEPVLGLGADVVAESPLWRVRRLVELAVSGGRRADPDPDRYAWAWLATTAHLAATERELIHSSWVAPGSFEL